MREDDNWRHWTVKERVVQFPQGVKLLHKHWLLYQNIRDAATTPHNAWTTKRGARIPWRQQYQQRLFLDGISTVLPVVIFWMIPFLGYVPMLLAVAAPRQLLSRHFHNDYEMAEYNKAAYNNDTLTSLQPSSSCSSQPSSICLNEYERLRLLMCTPVTQLDLYLALTTCFFFIIRSLWVTTAKTVTNQERHRRHLYPT